MDDLRRLRRERDLFARLLELHDLPNLDAVLRETLRLLVEHTGAQHGYVEIFGEDDEDPAVWVAHGFADEELQAVRGAISRGIIAEAVATGRTQLIESAMQDTRFRDRVSVRALALEAVLCAPVGDDPPSGILYLEGRAAPGPFGDEERTGAEVVARQLARVAQDVVARQRLVTRENPTAPWRKKLAVHDIIGSSAALADVLRQVAMVAPLDVSVLLTGPSGSGKTQLARAIHDNGPRAHGPFVELNCAAIPENLVESELFGAEAGAHSTATRSMPGKVAAAERGTLLLDEVGELPLGAQAKLLQLLQSRHYYPLGATKPVKANVRVLAATNSDLQTAVNEQRFREALYYRLYVLPIRMPDLRERREDVALLAVHFAEQARRQHGRRACVVAPRTLHVIASADWPGNVRQLANAMEAAALRATADGFSRIEPHHVFPEQTPQPFAGLGPSLQDATRKFQAQYVAEALTAHDWNVMETARHLGVARSYLYTMIRGFGLTRRS